MNDDLLASALFYLSRGMSILPIQWHSKAPAYRALRATGYGGDDGVASWGALRQEAPTWGGVSQWFGGARRNLGIVTGYGGLVVLDFDNLPAYEMWRQWAAAQDGDAPPMSVQTYRVFTAKGVHVYLRCAEPVATYPVPGIGDVKAAGGYVLAPPSVHPSGHVYVAADDWAPIIEVAHLADVFPFQKAQPGPQVARLRTPTGGAVVPPGDSIIERIKERCTCADLLGVDVAGRHHVMVCCPLHDDHNPSMIVYGNDGKCRCLAGCEGGKQLDVVDLYAAMHGIPLSHETPAIAQLAAELGLW